MTLQLLWTRERNSLRSGETETEDKKKPKRACAGRCMPQNMGVLGCEGLGGCPGWIGEQEKEGKYESYSYERKTST